MHTRLFFALCALSLLLPMTAFSQALDDYTLFSNANLVLRDRVKITNGLLGSNTGLQMGYDAALSGNVQSRGNMIMSSRSIVTGNVTLGGTLTKGSQTSVTGTVTVNAVVPSVTIPAITFPVGTQDITIKSGESRQLDPGAYRNVLVSTNGSLYLETGTYSFNSLTLETDVILTFKAQTGPVDIRVLSDLKIGLRDRLLAGRGLLNASDVRIYSHQTAPLSIGTDARIEAVLTLPRASVTVGDRTALTGKLRAKSVTIGYDAPVNGSTTLDADGDTMPDGWETVNGLNPNANDANSDFDSDGLINRYEFFFGTKPNVVDTDGDGLKDGEEYDYWDHRIGIIHFSCDSDVDNDGLINILDPDSDNDGLLDGQELKGWTVTVQGTTKSYIGDPGDSDSDHDGVGDAHEKDGYATDFPNHTVHKAGLLPGGDDDGDGVDFNSELTYGLNPFDEQTLGYMSDKKYYELLNHMGEWAVSPTTGHLNPQLASTATCILGAKVTFGDDTSTNMSIDRQMELSVFLPQDGRPITLQLDFVYDSSATPDANDRFYDLKYSGAVYPEGNAGAPAINFPGTNSNSITWRITDPLYCLKGDYFLNFSYRYDKNNGEKPRTLRLYAYYDDGTRVRIEYIVPVKGGTYKSPLHFTLLVAGGNQPAYFRGETAVSSASASYIDNVVLTDYFGNTVRNIGKKAFNGYWFQYELGKLNAYPGGVSGLTACQRLEFDWVHDATTDKHHNIFVIDEVGNNWDDVQITYNTAYQTQDYYCWYGGVARNTAVLRRETAIQMVATNSSLQYADAQVTIKNRAGTDVTSKFTVHKESGREDYAAYDGEKATWRENWIIEAPVALPVGMYTIAMRNGSTWSGSTSFYLIFNKTEMSLTDPEYRVYGYDEDRDGSALDTYTDAGLDLADLMDSGETPIKSQINLCSKIVVDITVAVIDGKTTLFAARDAIRIFTAKLIIGKWDVPATATGPADNVLQKSGVTIAEALSGILDDSHHLFGVCTHFADLSVGLSRSVGIPSRLVSGKGVYQPLTDPAPSDGIYKPSNNTWMFHTWTEAWIENPPSGTDKWYVFDATRFVGSLQGTTASRKQYGSLWLSGSAYLDVLDFMDPFWMMAVAEYYKP